MATAFSEGDELEDNSLEEALSSFRKENFSPEFIDGAGDERRLKELNYWRQENLRGWDRFLGYAEVNEIAKLNIDCKDVCNYLNRAEGEGELYFCVLDARFKRDSGEGYFSGGYDFSKESVEWLAKCSSDKLKNLCSKPGKKCPARTMFEEVYGDNKNFMYQFPSIEPLDD